MDLKSYDFKNAPVVIDPALLAEARERNFYNGHTPYNRLFSTLFFDGGSISPKEDITEEYWENVSTCLQKYMASYADKHQHKEAVCAMLLSEIADVT